MEELASFLTVDSRIDVKMMALQQVLGLSASPEGISALSCPPILAALMGLLKDPVEQVSSASLLSLVNLSSVSSSCQEILGLQPPLLPTLFKLLQEKRGSSSSKVAEKASMLLSNLTREMAPAAQVWAQMEAAGLKVSLLVDLLCQEGEGNLVYLGPSLSNLSQLTEVRSELMADNGSLLQRLLPFTEYTKSGVKRGGVVGALRNCCFATQHHPLLIGPHVDIVPRLVLPLAGPTPDHLTEEEVEALPVDLQYLDESKTVEEDVDIRTMLLESLMQLCATRKCREELRRMNIYLVLRQFHSQEKDNAVRLAAENLVDILIKTEEEINIDNYKNVDIPEEVIPKLVEMDKPYLDN